MTQYLIGVSVPLTLMALVGIGRWVRTILKQLEQVHDLAVDVNSAVNHRPKGDPKLYDMVKDAATQARENGEASARLEQQFTDHSRSDEINFADLRARLAPIDNAVNGRAPGEPTMSQDAAVSRLRDEAADAAAADMAADRTPGAADRASTATADDE